MDIRAEITNSIIKLIEGGAAKGEGQLWDAGIASGLPVNYKTKRPYSGINIPILWAAAMSRGCEKNEWLTFKQAQELGGQVKKGSKAVMGVFFSMLPRKDKEGELDANGKPIPMMKPFWLFNVEDIDGLPTVEKPTRTFEPIEEAERFLDKSGAKIIWGGSRAAYFPTRDDIAMPDRERFAKPANAYAVALHELTHWTGHESRLNRDFSGKFGTESYAFEELVAELGSAFLFAHLGLEGAKLENHASYIESWLKVLRNDKTAIFTASKHANAAFQFIMEKAGVSAEVDTVQ